MADPLSKQISNRNFLSPIGFNFVLAKYPKVSFFCNSAKIPEISLGTAIQPTYLKDLDVPGDKLTYADLSINFIVDENMVNYTTIHNWLTGLGSPESLQQYENLIDGSDRDPKKAYSDASLIILNSNYRSVASIKFKDLFPVSLTSLDFTATETDYNYFTATVSFKYTVYQILGPDGSSL
jgi:hypothetical protein